MSILYAILRFKLMKKNEKEEIKEETKVLTEKDELEIVYQFLKDRGFNSIGDIENRLAKL